MTFNVPAEIPPLSLARSNLLAHLRALAMVARREWLIFRRYPSWIVGMFIWPVIFPATYVLTARALAGPDGSGLALFKEVAGTADFLGYIGVGTTIWMWQNIVLWGVGFALRGDQLRGTLETNWLTPTWRFSFLLGHSLTDMVTTLIFLAVTALEFSLFFGVRFQGSLWLALLVLLVSIPSIYGLGITFASLVIAAKEANTFVFLVRGMVMVFCGITSPIILLPHWMQAVAEWLPPTHMIRAMRGAILSGASLPALLPDILALLGFGAFWLLVGYLAFNWMERRARVNGSIGHY